MRAHWGTRVPEGIGLGNLQAILGVNAIDFLRMGLTMKEAESLRNWTNIPTS